MIAWFKGVWCRIFHSAHHVGRYDPEGEGISVECHECSHSWKTRI